jgi:hypothetical protein
MKNDKVNNVTVEQAVTAGTDRCKTNADTVLNAFLNNSDTSVVTLTGENAAAEELVTSKSVDAKYMVRCKSEDVPSVAGSRRRERKLSTGRRRSVTAHGRTSLDRRYSSDVSSYYVNLFKTNGLYIRVEIINVSLIKPQVIHLHY